MPLSRREAIGSLLGLLSGGVFTRVFGSGIETRWRVATFRAEVTPPMGHPLMGGGIAPAQTVVDPLFVHGLVLLGPDNPIVLASVDWCEIRNEAYTRWREVLAEAAGTIPERVLVTCIHQHDAPVADLEAERLLEASGAKGRVCDLSFHEEAVQRAAGALRDGLPKARRMTHYGTGQAKVEQVASNRRYLGPDGKPAFARMSATKDAYAREQAEGTIDPVLKTLSFWDGDRPLVALSGYAVHPMSYYGRGGVSADFIGMARSARQAETPETFQMYASGCSGNVVAGKYNDGAEENRPALAKRMHDAMKAAWGVTQRKALDQLAFRTTPLRLEPRSDKGFSVEELEGRMKHDLLPFGQCLAALGLSWRKRADAGHKLDVPAVDFGGAQLLLFPAEAYVEFQLAAQEARPDSFVLVMGYGECAPGYIPIDRAFEEGDTNLTDWCWVAPGSEGRMREAIGKVLRLS
ncbi:MAG: hypothetical protein HUU16_11105 [Candidatus Omnitrophica bacterium]|nr:hypothetical protein [Candidatus Omnitrophota bacterium]